MKKNGMFQLIKDFVHLDPNRASFLFTVLVLMGFPVNIRGQVDEEAGCVVYIDSTHSDTRNFMKSASVKQQTTYTEQISSREGKFVATMVYDESMTDGMRYSLRMALDEWESHLNPSKPIEFHVDFRSDMSNDVQVKTTVTYSRITQNGKYRSIPDNLWHATGPTQTMKDTIAVNTNVDWRYSLISESYIGEANLTSALLRHIAHILGFGTSLRTVNGALHFCLPYAPSLFDDMIENSSGVKMSSFGYNTTTSTFSNYLKGSLYLTLPSGKYKVYTSASGYVEDLTCRYLSLSDDNLMNYPLDNPANIFGVDAVVLETLEAMGWDVKPYGLEVASANLDPIGYGSAYLPHTFCATSTDSTQVPNVTFEFQSFNSATKQYATIELGNDSTITTADLQSAANAIDYGRFFRGRVVCTDNSGIAYNKSVVLDMFPYFGNYEILNVTDSQSPYYQSFDLTIQCYGTTTGSITLSNEYAPSIYKTFSGSGELTFHIDNSFKIGDNSLMITLKNEYGTVIKIFDLGNLSLQAASSHYAIGALKNNREVRNDLIIRDADHVEFSADIPEDAEVSWMMRVVRDDGEYNAFYMGNTPTLSFDMTPQWYKEFFDGSKTNFDDETNVGYNEAVMEATITTSDGSDALTYPFQVDVLPTKPKVTIVNYFEEIIGGGIAPTVDMEIYAYNFNLAWMYVTAGNWVVGFNYIVDIDSSLPMPQTHRSEQGNYGCGYILYTQNDYGYVGTDTIYPPAELTNSVLRADNGQAPHLIINGNECTLRFNECQAEITVSDIRGCIRYREENAARASFHLPKGMYILKIRNNGVSNTIKFNIN